MRISAGERFLTILGYLPILFFIPLKAKRDSMFVQFHARQGAVLFLLAFVVAVLCFILLVPFANSILGQIIMFLLFVDLGLYAIMMLIGILKVLLGERYRMPVVADVALLMRL